MPQVPEAPIGRVRPEPRPRAGLQVAASAEDFGAGAGRATREGGQALQQAGEVAARIEEERLAARRRLAEAEKALEGTRTRAGANTEALEVYERLSRAGDLADPEFRAQARAEIDAIYDKASSVRMASSQQQAAYDGLIATDRGGFHDTIVRGGMAAQDAGVKAGADQEANRYASQLTGSVESFLDARAAYDSAFGLYAGSLTQEAQVQKQAESHAMIAEAHVEAQLAAGDWQGAIESTFDPLIAPDIPGPTQAVLRERARKMQAAGEPGSVVVPAEGALVDKVTGEELYKNTTSSDQFKVVNKDQFVIDGQGNIIFEPREEVTAVTLADALKSPAMAMAALLEPGPLGQQSLAERAQRGIENLDPREMRIVDALAFASVEINERTGRVFMPVGVSQMLTGMGINPKIYGDAIAGGSSPSLFDIPVTLDLPGAAAPTGGVSEAAEALTALGGRMDVPGEAIAGGGVTLGGVARSEESPQVRQGLEQVFGSALTFTDERTVAELIVGGLFTGPEPAVKSVLGKTPFVGRGAGMVDTLRREIPLFGRRIVTALQQSPKFAQMEREGLEEELSLEPALWDNENAMLGDVVGVVRALRSFEIELEKSEDDPEVSLDQRERDRDAIQLMRASRERFAPPIIDEPDLVKRTDLQQKFMEANSDGTAVITLDEHGLWVFCKVGCGCSEELSC